MVHQIPDAAEKFRHHILNILPVGHEHRQQRAQVQQHIKKFRNLRLQIQQVLRNGQMAGAGNGQKLCHTLDQSQKERCKNRHITESPL